MNHLSRELLLLTISNWMGESNANEKCPSILNEKKILKQILDSIISVWSVEKCRENYINATSPFQLKKVLL